MKKIEVMPKVVIYKDIIDNVEEILNIIKKSETNTDNLYKADSNYSISENDHGLESIPYDEPHFIKKWVPWYEFGIMSNFVFQYAGHDLDEDLNRQKNILIKLNDVIKKVFNDYAKDWKDYSWPEFVKKWELSSSLDESYDNGNMIFADLAILKHYVDETKKVAIPVHTDFHSHKTEYPGDKPIITITIYLNDDYDGGEIQFINTENQESIIYKPKAGDITVFPSGKPYWHAALPVHTNNKYLLRSFITYDYEGSENWHNSVKKYGEPEWNRMESERIKEETLKGLHALNITYDENYIKQNENEQILLIKNEKYIDGRNI